MRWLSAILVFYCFSAFAGNENYHLGARSAGMANASVTLQDMWAAHHNQAGLAFVEKTGFGMSYEDRFLLPELGVKGGVIALPVKSGTFGLTVNSFGYSSYSESKYGIGFAKKFGENFAIGLNLDYMNIRIAENYGSKNYIAAELGVLGKLTDQLTVGAHIFNPTRAKIAEFVLDSTSTYEEYSPTVMRAGISYTFSEKTFVTVETEKELYSKPMVKIGMEYHISAPLYLRAGIASNPFLSSFGFGLELNRFNLDIASSYHNILGFSPTVSLSYKFK